MVSISKFGDSAIKFTFDDSDHYLMGDGEITVPVNGLILVLDESDMATFKKIDGDPFISFNIADSNFSSKSDLETFYKENMVGSTGGGGVTSGEVQTMIDESISGKADTSDVQNVASDVATVSGDVSTLSGSVESNHNAITALNGDVQTLSGQVETDEKVTANALVDLDNRKLDASAYTPTDLSNYYTKSQTNTQINNATDSLLDAGEFYEYTGSNDERVGDIEDRLSEDEEVTSAALNELNDALDDKADTSAVTASIAAAVSGKQDTLIAGSGITISGNVISAEGGSITVDSAFSRTSENPVQNKVITNGATNGNGELTNTGGRYKWAFYSVGGVGTNQGFYLDTINGAPVINKYSNTRNLNLVETSAITSSVTSASTDSEIPSAKAVYDALQEGGGGGGVPESAFTAYTAATDARLAEDEEVTAAGLNALNDAIDDKADASDLGGLKLVQLTQAQYDALTTKDSSTLYIITNVVN